jgi:hypothetical protein
VTVQLAKGENLKKGDEAKFHANGRIFGENLAVRSLGHDLIGPAVAAEAAKAPDEDPARAASLHTGRLQARSRQSQ